MDKKYLVFDIETTGLNPWFGDEITCICAKDSEGILFQYVNNSPEDPTTEADMIEKFLLWINNRQQHMIISKNGKGFDVPFIMARAFFKDVEIKKENKILSGAHIDLHYVTNKFIGLDDMARLLGCDLKSGNGFNAIKLFREGKFHQLKDYCMQDVLVTEQVFQKLNQSGIVPLP